MPIYVKGKGFVLSAEDLPLVLETARKNPDSFKRCQILAEVAWHTKDSQRFDGIIRESLAAAWEQKRPNRIVFAASTSVWVMASRAHQDLSSIVADLLKVLAEEPNAVRRGDALILLFEAAYRDLDERSKVLSVLLQTCEVMGSWRREHILAEAAVTLAIDDIEIAERVIELIREEKFVRRARREIESGYVGPHQYLPFYERTRLSQS